MQTNHSVFNAFDRRRIRFSDWIVQYAIVFTLLFFSLLFGSYYFFNQQHEKVLVKINELNEIVLSSSQLRVDWQRLKVKPNDSVSEVVNLLNQESAIAQQFIEQLPDVVGLPSAPITMSKFSLEEQIDLAENRLKQITQIALATKAGLTRGGLLSGLQLVGLLSAWSLILFYLIWGWRRVYLDRKTAIQFFHAQVDRAQAGGFLTLSTVRNDEFGEFSRYLNSHLHVYEAQVQNLNDLVRLHKEASSLSLTPKLVINSDREILMVSEGFRKLWDIETESISELLGLDLLISKLDGEVLSKEVLSKCYDAPLMLAGQAFQVRTVEISLDHDNGHLIEFSPFTSNAELRVLEASLNLMLQDVWDAPIRILDNRSPYFSFSNKLESIRQQILEFINHSNQFVKVSDKEYSKITKLQQLSDWMDDKLKHVEFEVTASLSYRDQLHQEVKHSKVEFLKVREQIEYRFELYEAYLQQLLEWQASQSTWVATVNHGLMDAKEAILNLLSISHTEPTSTSVIEHSVIDLTHDIDTVLASIVDSKPLPKELRLEHIKSSESDLMRHLNNVQTRLDVLSKTVNRELLEKSDPLNVDK